MTSTELERLVGPRGLKREPPSRTEYEGLVHSGKVRLEDAVSNLPPPDLPANRELPEEK